jgi:predicted RNase H-like nuclease (RuvC/YqgF family)
MNELLTIMTSRELFLIIFGTAIYIVLFIVTVQNSRRKILSLQERLDKVRAMQEQFDIEGNEQKMAELENLIKKLGDENSMLKLELEEKKLALDYNNKVAIIENAKREQAETVIFSSDIYRRIQECLNSGRSLNYQDWSELTQLLNSIYTGFTEKLYSLYRMSEHELHVSLLTKAHLQPKDIAMLTAHSKESIATTRSRLYSKVFGKKGSSKDWDDFILTL